MISIEDCVAMCGLNAQEVMAIAEHEHVPDMAAAAIGRYLLTQPDGPLQIRRMISDDIKAALARDDGARASELVMVLRHFLNTHPDARTPTSD